MQNHPNLKLMDSHVVYGVSTSRFLLNATIRFYLEKHLGQNERLVDQLLCCTYVDDELLCCAYVDHIITTGQTEEEVLQLCSLSKEIFCEGGFNFRKFLTNSKSVQQQVELMETSNQPLPDKPTYSRVHTWNFSTCESRRLQGAEKSHGVLKLLISISMSLIFPSLQKTYPDQEKCCESCRQVL